ncbi:FKBP-type peptidyl-prolyl cis-trans isomerase [Flavobacterium sp.]|uniref:FKBP-type peptidyl-prolyl cis-trans isomerase n=1 Tax=Flavobacterium sp. TaxID=239 RepID=UPI00286CF37C|nr:FKBP-type peptidyl-prolyl cis-trans isomerase [Flavobacterium sp.]
MTQFFKIAFALSLSILFIACNKTDDPIPEVPPVPFATQYPVDLAAIDKYLDDYAMTVNANFDVTFTKIPAGDITTQDIKQQYAPLYKTVNSNGVDYKVYYISLREGTQKNPSKVDSVFVDYKGSLLNETVFDRNYTSPIWFPLNGVVRGWQEIFPFFKSGTVTAGATAGDPNVYSDFGAGVMFLPSGLAYYNRASTNIPSYSPLIFSFKLKSVNYVDNDFDGIDSRDEGIDTSLDTDGDTFPNYFDQDDDGDGYLTKSEIRINGVLPTSYSLIKDCSGNATGTKKHLDASCH